jgi:hypothetical protein
MSASTHQPDLYVIRGTVFFSHNKSTPVSASEQRGIEMHLLDGTHAHARVSDPSHMHAHRDTRLVCRADTPALSTCLAWTSVTYMSLLPVHRAFTEYCILRTFVILHYYYCTFVSQSQIIRASLIWLLMLRCATITIQCESRSR